MGKGIATADHTLRRFLCRWRVLVVVAVGSLAASAETAFGQAIAPARPIFHRERSFRIPYEVDPAQQPRIKEVQLFVSTDRGASWRHVTSGPAPTKKEFFTFTAQGNGEHWFTVRTVDFDGRGDPPSLTGVQPQLLVVVDTTAPQVQLRGLSLPGDEAGIEWSIFDEHLDIATLRVEYRVGSADWFAVPVQPAAEGKTRFRPGVRGPIDLRLRVLDRAGNEALEQVTLQSAGVGGATPAMPISNPGQPGFSAQPNFNGQPGYQAQPGIPAFGTGMPTAPSAGPPGMDGGFSVPPRPNVTTPIQPGGAPFGVAPPPNPGGSSFVPQAQTQPQMMPQPQTMPRPTAGPPTGGGMYLPAETGMNPPLVGSLPGPSGPTGNPPPAQPVSMPVTTPAPARTNVQLVNSTKFGINYEVAEVGRSGLGAVALYWTYDTNTWNYHGDDEDQESPFPIDVDGEGVFGFKLIARSKAGLGDDPPRAGDQPDVWVEVDITPPEIDLRPPQPGRGASSGILDIQWQARDKNPAPKSVSLYYSEEPSGPFKPIAEGIENTGRYQWQVPSDPDMPYKFFVRMECKDRAGNVGRAETPTPVVVDLVRPRLKIITVEPATKSSELDDISLPP